MLESALVRSDVPAITSYYLTLYSFIGLSDIHKISTKKSISIWMNYIYLYAQVVQEKVQHQTFTSLNAANNRYNDNVTIFYIITVKNRFQLIIWNILKRIVSSVLHDLNSFDIFLMLNLNGHPWVENTDDREQNPNGLHFSLK